ncbi:hypothetical protein SUGI_0628000 [Cryptomeria japonica]|uniref:nuclear pore complex protein NUP107 n=1 Tax=Cryptomeria japonica TaxID=3369 RepID=UPI002414B142|nr:nuclear pore complex protein NUP107 [Cryptomeria japonica]GLJ31305.1 hypothetical protein SUGI_0628000 [Cryptomeria japonica]
MDMETEENNNREGGQSSSWLSDSNQLWPDFVDPSDREQYRRYRKRSSLGSHFLVQEKSSANRLEAGALNDKNAECVYPSPALFLEDIKQELEVSVAQGVQVSPGARYSLTTKKGAYSDKRSSQLDNTLLTGTQSSQSFLKAAKQEPEEVSDSGETTFSRFEAILDSALQGFISFADLILQFETTCREVSELIREEATGRHRIIEDRLMRQKAQMLIDEAATWSLLWYLFGKGTEDNLEDVSVCPSTSQQEACEFVMTDLTAQLCLRIVQWLEGLAYKAVDLDKKVKGWYAGSYLHTSGVWHQTQRLLRKKAGNATIVHHVDFDATTREQTKLHPEDQKQEQELLEDVWVLLRAGRLKEACELCRSAGQAWRAGILCGPCGFDPCPSVEELQQTGKNRTLQAIELESGLGYQRRLWKWASFCASEKIAQQDGGRYEAAIYAAQCSNLRRLLPVCRDWESACWAMVKSWLDVQVDSELAHLHQENPDQFKHTGDATDGNDTLGDLNMEGSSGPDAWPHQVLDQQPRDLQSLFQKLHSEDLVPESVRRGCKEQHRQIQICIMLEDASNLLDLLRAWIAPPNDANSASRPYGHPQMIRFGAHLVLVLRHVLGGDAMDVFREKLQLIGDLILNTYAIFLFSQKREELVGVYASQLAPYLCVELYVNMMELRLNDRVHVKYKIFRSAIQYLPFFPGDTTKGCVSDILERVLIRSREVRPGTRHMKAEDAGEQHRLESLEKATAVQWLCLTPPASISDSELLKAELLARALQHSNILFREFALISIWRTIKMPVGAHMLLSYLAEPLKQPTELLLSLEQHNVSENLQEFEDWREYYACDALYRNWLKIEIDNEEVSLLELSSEEREKAIVAARQALNTSLSLLGRKGSPWLSGVQGMQQETVESEWLELHGFALFRLSSGECLQPDATICTALTSALYFSAGEVVTTQRQLSVDVSICTGDKYCIEVVLRCLAVKGDGIGPCIGEDGGLLASIMAAAFKGELERFQVGVALEVFQLDAWYDKEGSQEAPAKFIVLGICRRCCIPELILRCMHILVSLADLSDGVLENHTELIELIASPDSELHHLFSQQQLQDFLLFEREFCVRRMEAQEDKSVDNAY